MNIFTFNVMAFIASLLTPGMALPFNAIKEVATDVDPVYVSILTAAVDGAHVKAVASALRATRANSLTTPGDGLTLTNMLSNEVAKKAATKKKTAAKSNEVAKKAATKKTAAKKTKKSEVANSSIVSFY
jgi:hypothetical protein